MIMRNEVSNNSKVIISCVLMLFIVTGIIFTNINYSLLTCSVKIVFQFLFLPKKYPINAPNPHEPNRIDRKIRPLKTGGKILKGAQGAATNIYPVINHIIPPKPIPPSPI